MSEIKEQLSKLIKNPDLEALELSLRKPDFFSILRVQTQEIRHSNFLAWLLDPKEGEYLSNQFNVPIGITLIKKLIAMTYKVYKAVLYKPTSKTGHSGHRVEKESYGNLGTAEYELLPKDFIPFDSKNLSGEIHYCIEEYEVTEKKISDHYYVKKRPD
ncbi:MAG TPA: PD-(D/E)XK nuclease family protein [Bacteroidales bacterium]|nr:PD-(D/E)XK nuclease family protein [Bacteroidales bacterium]